MPRLGGGPDEGCRAFIIGRDAVVDSLAESGDGAKDAALEAVPGELGEEALDRVELGSPGRAGTFWRQN